MPTIAQGDHADITLAAASIVTLQNPSGYCEVEAPVGATVAGGGAADWFVRLEAGDIRISAITRDVYYEVHEEPSAPGGDSAGLPDPIVPDAVLVGNDAGDAARWAGNIAVSEDGSLVQLSASSFFSTLTLSATAAGLTSAGLLDVTAGGTLGISTSDASGVGVTGAAIIFNAADCDGGDSAGSIGINAGRGIAGANGGGIGMSAGDGAVGGAVSLLSGVGSDGAGGDITLTTSHGKAGSQNGRLLLILDQTVGTPGSIDITGNGADVAAPNNAQTVTVGNVGPGSAAISIKAWLPINVDGHARFLPLFGV